MNTTTFTKNDLRLGYIVRCRNELFMVMCDSRGHVAFVDRDGGWLDLDKFDDELRDTTPLVSADYTVSEVYGYNRYFGGSIEISTNCRELLWKREDPVKKMTVEEIEKELGYKVEIVGGHK